MNDTEPAADYRMVRERVYWPNITAAVVALTPLAYRWDLTWRLVYAWYARFGDGFGWNPWLMIGFTVALIVGLSVGLRDKSWTVLGAVLAWFVLCVNALWLYELIGYFFVALAIGLGITIGLVAVIAHDWQRTRYVPQL